MVAPLVPVAGALQPAGPAGPAGDGDGNGNGAGAGDAAPEPDNNNQGIEDEDDVLEGEEYVINFGAQMPIFQQKTLGPDDPERMYLSPEEVEWAQAIKDLANNMPELEPLTDFQCAQLALLEHDNVDAALKRALHLQTFREEYGVRDSDTAGRQEIKNFIELFPKHWLSFSFNKSDGNYVFVYDMKSFNPRLLKTPEKFDNFMRATYYIVNCLTVDMTSIRRGCVIMAECDGYDFTKNIDSKTYKRFWGELAVAYPIRFQKMKHFNSGVFVNLLYSMTKPIFPAYIRSVFEVGNHLDDGRTLDEIFLAPTVEGSNQRLLTRLTRALKRRYDHEKTFSLKDTTAMEDK